MSERFFHPAPLEASGDRLRIQGDEARHLARVMRRRPGDTLVVFDGMGREAAATIVAIERGEVVVEVDVIREVTRMPVLRIELFCAFPRGGAAEDLVRRAIECGAAAVGPLEATRSVHRPVRWNDPARVERFRRIAVAAMKQCGRNVLPERLEPTPVADLRLPEGAAGVFGCAGDGASTPREIEAAWDEPPSRVVVVIGPEGGLTSQEEAILRDRGFRAVTIGPTTLRVETAVVAHLSWLASLRFSDAR